MTTHFSVALTKTKKVEQGTRHHRCCQRDGNRLLQIKIYNSKSSFILTITIETLEQGVKYVQN